MTTAVHWQCPYCRRHATITDSNRSSDQANLRNAGKDGHAILSVSLTTCPSPECGKYQLQAWLYPAKVAQYGLQRKTPTAARYWQLVPASNAVVFPDFVPNAIRDDYTEATLIAALSPKSAATLARRALQGMIRDVWKVKKRNLAQAIEAIKKKVDPEAWKAIDGVRTIGNIGAHMEKDVNLIVPVERHEAEALLRLIEALVEDWYIKPREREALYAKVAAAATAKAAARKQPIEATSASGAPPASPEAAEVETAPAPNEPPTPES